jgi:ribulose-phosphate 3-epimerase
MVHVDAADGHYVPDLTVGPPVVRRLRQATDLVLDVHLMIERPERYVGEFVEAGADRLSVHAEATPNLQGLLENVRRQGAKVGVAIHPATPLEALSEILGEVDFVNILTSDAGIKKRRFLPAAGRKVQQAAREREERRLNFQIEVEGAISLGRIEELVPAGADILVTGSAIFDNSDPKARLAEMIRMAAAARQGSKV